MHISPKLKKLVSNPTPKGQRIPGGGYIEVRYLSNEDVWEARLLVPTGKGVRRLFIGKGARLRDAGGDLSNQVRYYDGGA